MVSELTGTVLLTHAHNDVPPHAWSHYYICVYDEMFSSQLSQKGHVRNMEIETPKIGSWGGGILLLLCIRHK